jgi:murein DD-endopeptidase
MRMIRVGVSSLRILRPAIAMPTWLGLRRPDRRVPILNYVNRVRAPRDQGYSVRVTYARDWRGGRRTYDGHLGTDFAVPIGTTVVAAAAGVVLHVGYDLAAGGLKVCIDHGDGLLTTSNHLSRALVRPGDLVARAAPIGRSGASGLELALCFPWLPPHLHLNVWLDGEPVDPFAADDSEIPLWRAGNDPTPAIDGIDAPFVPTAFCEAGVADAIAACRDPDARRRLATASPLPRAACELLLLRNYRPARFTSFPRVYRGSHPRAARLDLPFRTTDFVGVSHPA